MGTGCQPPQPVRTVSCGADRVKDKTDNRMTGVKVKIVMRIVPMLAMVAGVRAQFEEEEETFRGQLIGSLNSYHHQVNSSLLH